MLWRIFFEKFDIVMQEITTVAHNCLTNGLVLLRQSSHFSFLLFITLRGHGCAVVTHSPPSSEVGGSNTARFVGNMVVAY